MSDKQSPCMRGKGMMLMIVLNILNQANSTVSLHILRSSNVFLNSCSVSLSVSSYLVIWRECFVVEDL